MRAEWRSTTLDDVCSKITDGAHNSPKSVDIGMPMASVKDLTFYGVDLSDARLISIEEYKKLVAQGCKPEVGDVLIAKDGNSALDTVCVVKEPLAAVMLSSVAILRPDSKKLDSYYLKYYFSSKSVISYLKRNFISGAAIPRVVLRDFKKAEITLPSLDIQRKISSLLCSLDNKIELNCKMNQTLEEMAQTIFKSWFVDFDPVHAKMACTNEKELQQAAKELGISKEILDLFPNEFEESELGMIPKGWEVGTFASNCKIVYGKNLPTTKLVESGYEVYGGNGIIGYHSQYLYDKQQVLIACRGAASGAVHISNPYSFVTNNSLIIELLEQSILNFEYMSELAKSSDFTIYVTGSAQPQITIQSINGHKFIIPNENLLLSWKKLIEVVHSKILLNSNEVDVLRKTRDTLLPKLLSGELDVSNINL